jgi:nitrilase
MPLLRQSLYSQNVNLYLAPTADGRDTWLPLLQTIACEGRCIVLSANQCMTKSNLPTWITKHEERRNNEVEKENENPRPLVSRLRRKSTITEDGNEIALPGNKEDVIFHPEFEILRGKPQSKEFISRGGSCIVSPMGDVISGPLWDDENGLLIADVDFDDCLRGRLDLDVGGSYSR